MHDFYWKKEIADVKEDATGLISKLRIYWKLGILEGKMKFSNAWVGNYLARNWKCKDFSGGLNLDNTMPVCTRISFVSNAEAVHKLLLYSHQVVRAKEMPIGMWVFLSGNYEWQLNTYI